MLWMLDLFSLHFMLRQCAVLIHLAFFDGIVIQYAY